ncbi:AraC family transcriptional regulator [Pararhizobium haloflavum]|uniref:AraC family transcriptional regulator n=1 Tax=Pararhizobium haloflavum TaxID=2037914 RepID=UPI0018E45D0E|nr:AraC family transcriptional regulator [Pararhizobium haloflavum]
MKKASSFIDRFEVAASLGATLPERARTLGLDLEPLARTVGLDPTCFTEFSVHVSLDRMCRLFDALATLSGRESFGLEAADAYEPGMSGAYGYGIMTAPSLMEALEFAVRHVQVVMDTHHFRLHVDTREVRLSWAPPSPVLRSDQFVDFLTCLYVARLRGISETAVRNARFRFVHPPPNDIVPFRARLSPNLRFLAPVNEIVFPRLLADATNPKSDPKLFRLMEAQCKSMHRPSPAEQDLVTSLRLHIADHLTEGTPTLQMMATHVGMSPRTLQRRLADQGMNVNDIVDTTRRELARRLLSDEKTNLSEVARRLGFSQQSALTRAAYRWFERSPSQLRRNGGER